MTKRNNDSNSKGFLYSGILHFALLMLAIFGLPEIWRQHRESLPVAMTVEVLPLGQTNVKPKEESQATKTKKELPLTALRARTATQSNKPTPKPMQKKESVPLPTPKKAKDKPKPEPKKKEEPKKETQEPQDLDAILKSIEQAAKAEQSDKVNKETKTESKKARSDDYNPNLPMAMSEIDAISNHFRRCWDMPVGAKNAHTLVVLLNVKLLPDGTVSSVELAQDRPRYYTDTFFRAAADSAMRAVNKCNKVPNLPPHKYETWKELEINFDPKDVLY